jgi:RNA polymerase sigma factor (sigma-70 family)
MKAMGGPGQPFQALLDEHREAVVIFLRGLVGPLEAEDCAQETFLAALRAFPRFDGRNPRAWILTIARNKATDSWRARRRRPESLTDRVADEVALGPAAEREDAEIWDAVSTLPDGQRSALVLRFAVDLRYRDIGETLGCSEAAARQRVTAALRALRGGAVARGG